MRNRSRYKKPSFKQKKILAKTLTNAPRPRRPLRSKRAKRHNFIQFPHNLLEHNDLSDNAKLVWAEISKWGGEPGNESYPGIEKMSSDLDKSNRTIKRGVDELVNKNLLTRKRRKGTSSLSQLYVPENQHKRKEQIIWILKKSSSNFDMVATNERDNSVLSERDNSVLSTDGNLSNPEGDNSPEKCATSIKVGINKSIKTGEPNGAESHKSQHIDLFDSVNSKDLKDKKPSNYNVNELIAYFQHNLNAEVGYEYQVGNAGKHRGRFRDLKDKLGGAGEAVKYLGWWIEHHGEDLEGMKDTYQLSEITNYVNEYSNWKKRQRKSKRLAEHIDSGAPDVEEKDVGSMEEARAKMG